MNAEDALKVVDALRETILQPEELVKFDEGIQDQDRYSNIGLTSGAAVLSESVELTVLDSLAIIDEIDDTETDFELKLPDFLNPNIILNTSDQLATMLEFWHLFCLQVPELDTFQQIKLDSILLANPNLRVVPTPLLDIVGRKAIVELARVTFSKNEIHPTLDALKTPHNYDLPGQLLANPEFDIKDRTKNAVYGLRYKTPGGDLVNRIGYIASMLESKHAISSVNDIVWTFPVMDVAVSTNRKYDEVKNIFPKIEPVCTPESLIAVHLLHQANGAPNTEWEIDLSNEAVYQIVESGTYLTDVISVSLLPNTKQLVLYNRSASSRKKNYGSRSAISGI